MAMTSNIERFLSSSTPSRNMERVAIRRRDPHGLYSIEDANDWAKRQSWYTGKEHLAMTHNWFAWFKVKR